MSKFLSFLKIILLVIVVWFAQILFLYQASRTGFNGWDDWGQLFYYDAYNARDLRNLPFIAKETGTPYMWTEEYNIGSLKDIFGIEQRTIKLIQLLFKTLAALAVAFLAFKLTKDKLLVFFILFFFIVFPSTAGVLPHIIFAGAYLTIVFMCFSVLFYIQSVDKPKKIFLASVFFFLALLVSPPRAYFILPVPFLVELYRLKREFKIVTFLKRLFIFYSPLIFLQSRPGIFIPHLEFLARLKQVASGNLYSLSFPFQAMSALYVDKTILNEMLTTVGLNLLLPYPDVRGLIVIDSIFVILTFLIGLTIKVKKIFSFILAVLGLTLLLQTIFLVFGFVSSQNGTVTYINYTVGSTYSQTLSSSIYQAAIGGFYFVLGLFISRQWFNQRNNRILMIMSVAWFWTISTELLLYATNHWYTMVDLSLDRYTVVASVGAVIFAGGIFSLATSAIAEIKKFNFKILSFLLLIIFLLLGSWKNFELLDKFFFNWNEKQGMSAYWQDTVHQRFLSKVGSENLKRPMIVYVDPNSKEPFIWGAFIHPSRYRLFYDEKDNLIRDNCKAITGDFKELKSSFVTQEGEKGFFIDSICTNPEISFQMKKFFYPLQYFYAYRQEEGDFKDIKDEIISQITYEKH